MEAQLHQTRESIYKDAWLQLNHITLKPISKHSAPNDQPCTFYDALRYFTNESTTSIFKLPTLTTEEREYLLSNGIVEAYVKTNLGQDVNSRYHDSKHFQLNAVRMNAVYALCPFSGAITQTSHSLVPNLNTIFYRFRTRQVFYLVVAGIGSGFKKQALYFPEADIAVTTGDPWAFEPEDLAELKARMVYNFSLCHEYLSYQHHGRSQIALCVGFYHFAHHLWNELSGLRRICKAKLLTKVDKILVMREPLGPLEQIFPELPIDRIKRINTNDTLFAEILTNRYLAIRVGDDFLPQDLLAAVYRIVLRNCLAETLRAAHEARQKHWPLLWIGIRVGSRTWADQGQGLALIITSLHKEYPRLGVVFDGFSLPADRLTVPDEYINIIQQERAVVSEVVDRLRKQHEDVGIFDIIGSSIFDANIWAHAIDVYISSYGSLQHKVGWLANKTGIIHGNQSILRSPARFVWSSVENAKIPRYLSHLAVSDVQSRPLEHNLYKRINDYTEVGAGNKAADRRTEDKPDFNNYTVEWNALLKDVMELIQPRNRIFDISIPVVINSVRKKLQRNLQSFLGCVIKSRYQL